MLTSSQSSEFSAISLCILPNLGQALANALAQFRQVVLILKVLIHPDISFVLWQPTRTMTTVVGDIEWLVALRCLCQFGLRHRVGIIDSAQLFVLGHCRTNYQPYQNNHQVHLQSFHIAVIIILFRQ